MQPAEKHCTYYFVNFLLISLFQATLYYVQSPEEHKVVVGQELKLGLDFPYKLQRAMKVIVIPEEGLVLSYKGAPFMEKNLNTKGNGR